MIEVLLALALGLAAGWALTRRLTPQQRHDRAVAEFVERDRLSPVDGGDVVHGITVTLEGIRLRYAGRHPDGAHVYVNDQPLPDADGLDIGPLPDGTAVVIVESRR